MAAPIPPDSALQIGEIEDSPVPSYTALVFKDGSCRIVQLNDRLLSFLHLTREEAQTKGFILTPFLHPDDVERINQSIHRAMETPGVWQEEFRIVMRDGSECSMEVIGTVKKYDEDSVIFRMIFVDITERKIFEEKAEVLRIVALENEVRYKALADNLEEPLVLTDKEGNFLYVNDSAASIFGQSKEQLLRTADLKTINPEMWAIRQEKIDKALASNQSITDEVGLTIHGEQKWYRRRFTPIIRKDQKPMVMIIAVEITKEHNEKELLERFNAQLELKVEERTVALREALQKQKEYSDLQAQFIATTSHEFRTPLAVISLATGFIRRYSHLIQDEKLKEKLKVIDWQVSKMAILLEEILTLQKSESGLFRSTLMMHSLGAIVKGALDETSMSVSARVNLLLQQTIDRVKTDQQLLHLILTNLISNALKFSSPDSVVTIVVSNPDDSHFSITVTDKGIGIPAADLDSVFLPFVRSANATTIQGTGLGLAIVKRAVDTLQGTVCVASEVGKGTTFTLVLPIQVRS